MILGNDVLAVLSRAETKGNTLSLVGQLDRNMYTRVNKAIEAAGGKWNRKIKAHVFDDEAATRIDQIILSGEVVVPKDDFEFFPTPPDVVNRILEIAEIKNGMLVLEPSAGHGAIVVAAHDSAENVMVDMYDLMPENVSFLQSLDLPISNVSEACDFLSVDPNPVYDRILMNPPFGKQADIKHVLHALKFLKPGGLLVSVMSAGVAFRDNKLTKDFRDAIDHHGGFIEELPEGSFKKSGTMVKTVIVAMNG